MGHTESANAPSDRRVWMGLLARAPEGAAAALLAPLEEGLEGSAAFEWLRRPEIGSVMVRGRAGGTGAAFNLGEMTVTRCALRLASGEVGHGYVQGRRARCAETAALIDALMQTDRAPTLQSRVLTPLANALEEGREARAAKAAATKVDFFTMVRGDD